MKLLNHKLTTRGDDDQGLIWERERKKDVYYILQNIKCSKYLLFRQRWKTKTPLDIHHNSSCLVLSKKRKQCLVPRNRTFCHFYSTQITTIALKIDKKMFRSKKNAKMTICTMFSLSFSINKRINPKEFILGKIRLPLSSFLEEKIKRMQKMLASIE